MDWRWMTKEMCTVGAKENMAHTDRAITMINSYPNKFFIYNNLLYFSANNAGSSINDQLWRTDGSKSGTYLVRDICQSSNGLSTAEIHNFIEYNGKLYFTSDDANVGNELFTSTGLNNTTYSVANINPNGHAFPNLLTVYDSLLYFVADNGSLGRELWVSDGTTTGTHLVKDIYLGSIGADITDMVVYNNLLYFTATDSAFGSELWVTDGTFAGTQIFLDLNPGTTGSEIRNLTVSNNKLYFTAFDYYSFSTLWVSDGTIPGTTQLHQNFSYSPSFEELTDINGIIYFSINSSNNGLKDIWTSDGTVLGTQLLRANANLDGGCSFTALNGMVYFVGFDNASRVELWVTDGTPTGTSLVKDIAPELLESHLNNLKTYNNRIFFSAADDMGGIELYSSDGTDTGTVRVKDINLLYTSSTPYIAMSFNNKVFMSANVGTNTFSRELWVSDGTAIGTQYLRDYNTSVIASNPTYFVQVDSIVFFNAFLGNLWKTDGTNAGTQRFDSIYYYGGGAAYNGKFYFRGWDFINQHELWVSDGTIAGTQLLKVMGPPGFYSYPNNFKVFNGKLFFTAYGASSGLEVWVSDGTSAGTYVLKDICIGCTNYYQIHNGKFTEYRNKLYFVTEETSKGFELWETDGTNAGTRMVADLNVGSASSYPNNLTVINNALYFSANDGNGNALWVYRDRAVPTIVKRFPSAAHNLQLVNNTFFFIASNNIWYSDGTASGTAQLRDNNNNLVTTSSFTSFGTYMLFSNSHPSTGNELWISDGSSQGTHLLVDINPGTGDSNPAGFTASGGLIYFSANNGTHGNELWAMDPLTLSIQKIKDINANFQIYPNPSTDQFTIQLDDFDAAKANRLRIFNLQGQLIKEMPLSNPITQIEVKDLPAGIYFVQLNEGATRKLVKN